MLISSRVDEIKGASHIRPRLSDGSLDRRTMGNGFRVFRNVRSDRGVQRTVKVGANKVGRPPLYGVEERKFIAGFLRQYGLTKAQKALESEGAKISMTVLRSVAQEHNIVFQKGRPAKVA